MDRKKRRDFLKSSSVFALSLAGSAFFVSACSSCKKKSIDLSCTDVSKLTEPERQARQALKYVEKTADETKRCDNCQFFVVPKTLDACGGCQVVAGPINPAGYCTSWFKKA